jgi:hypothetical protein
MNASDILSLLKDRHHKDIFIAGCKNGPTGTADGLVILDAWAMTKSWANLSFFGYEIKVSRSDFLRDQKWRRYLDLCDQFYFVCPYGMIQPNELPSEAGLIWVSKGGSRLFTKKKAPQREITVPVGILLYIMMWRATFTIDERDATNSEARWKRWLERRMEQRSLGAEVSRSIRARVDAAEHEVYVARHKLQQVEELLKFLGEMQIAPGYQLNWREQLTTKLIARHSAFTPELERELASFFNQAVSLREKLKGIQDDTRSGGRTVRANSAS